MTLRSLLLLVRKHEGDILSLLCLALFSVGAYFFSALVSEPDNLYHIAHASLYRAQGIFTTAFPWDSVSVFRQYQSDVWYGFHLFLTPFIQGTNYSIAIESAGASMLFALAATFYFILKKLGIRAPLFWTFFLFFSNAHELRMMASMRPHVLISLLAALFVYALAFRKSRKILFFIAVSFSFIELSMLWVPVVIFCLTYSCEKISLFLKTRDIGATFKDELVLKLEDCLAILLGLALGASMRPNPVAGLHLFYTQIIYFAVEKFKGVPLPFGVELYPLRGFEIFVALPLIGAFLVAGVIWLRKTLPEGHSKGVSRFVDFSFWISSFFLLIALVSAERALDFFSLFAVLCIATVWHIYGEEWVVLTQTQKKCILLLMAGLVILSPFFLFFSKTATNGVYVDENKQAALWLESHSNEGDIVAHFSFADFPGLFLWNKKNHYVNHADPIFQHAFNPDLDKRYLCAYYYVDEEILSNKKIQNYCLEEPYSDALLYQIIKNDFHARYVFLGRYVNDSVRTYFENQLTVKLVWSDSSSVIYEL